MAISISPPSSWISAGRPSCICSKIATALFSQIVRSHSSTARCIKVAFCGGTRLCPDFPSSRRKGLSGEVAGGRVASSATMRRISCSVMSYERVVLWLMFVSELFHICLKLWPLIGSMYLRFDTELWDHWDALRLISTEFLFMSYSFSILSNSWTVAVLWMQNCRTAPSINRGQPIGMCDSSSASPLFSMIDPSIGTSIVAFRLTCSLLLFQVSPASRPLSASIARAGKCGSSPCGNASSLMTNLRPCMGWGSSWCAGVVCACGIVESSNHVGRTDLIPISWEWVTFLMHSLRRLWYIGGIIHAGTNTVMNWTFHISSSLQRCDQNLQNCALSLTTKCGARAKLILSISVTSEFRCKDMDLGWPALTAWATKSQVLWVYQQCKLQLGRFLLRVKKPLQRLIIQLHLFCSCGPKNSPSSTRTFSYCNCRWTRALWLLQEKLVLFRFQRRLTEEGAVKLKFAH